MTDRLLFVLFERSDGRVNWCSGEFVNNDDNEANEVSCFCFFFLFRSFLFVVWPKITTPSNKHQHQTMRSSESSFYDGQLPFAVVVSNVFVIIAVVVYTQKIFFVWIHTLTIWTRAALLTSVDGGVTGWKE